MQRDGIASAALSYCLRITPRGTALADQPLGCFVVTNGATDLARIEHGRDLSVWLLIEQKANRGAVYLGSIAMQVAVGDLRFRDRCLAVHERDLGRRRKGSGALGVNELRRHRRDKDEARYANRDHP